MTTQDVYTLLVFLCGCCVGVLGVVLFRPKEGR